MLLRWSAKSAICKRSKVHIPIFKQPDSEPELCEEDILYTYLPLQVEDLGIG